MPSWHKRKEGRLLPKMDHRTGPVELASCSFGQSSKISYIQMATAICAVVNGGERMQPYVVAQVRDAAGRAVKTAVPTVKRRVLSPATSAVMRAMMEQVVLAGGGHNAQITGYRVGGKSGTSQKLDSADEKARIASFVAVAPIDDPQYLVMVCLDEPHSWTTAGGSLSAPVCAEVLEKILVYRGVPRAAAAESGAAAQPAAAPANGSGAAESAGALQSGTVRTSAADTPDGDTDDGAG